ncbi:MAG: CopD family protein [Gammaproteobacteria bacterium]|nr:CopD family protein [Gammaproteobacteria bacterium]
MLWVKSLHIIFMVTWFAGLFYLPRLFVYHAMTDSAEQSAQFKVMERKLLIMTHIGGALTALFGFWLLSYWPMAAIAGMGWLHIKLTLVVVLWFYHYWCRKLVIDFREDRNTHSHKWYRWFNEAPSVLLIVIILLVELQPF